MQFKKESIEGKNLLYHRILKGLVFFPGSQVKEIDFTNVNLEFFTLATE
jgi:hypothetical protein